MQYKYQFFKSLNEINVLAGDNQEFVNTIFELAEKYDEFYVDSWDDDQKGFVSTKATAFKTRENANLVEVVYGRGNPLSDLIKDEHVKCTPDHKFLVCKEHNKYYGVSELEWIEAKDLVSGTRLVAEDLYIVVKDVIQLKEKEDEK